MKTLETTDTKFQELHNIYTAKLAKLNKDFELPSKEAYITAKTGVSGQLPERVHLLQPLRQVNQSWTATWQQGVKCGSVFKAATRMTAHVHGSMNDG